MYGSQITPKRYIELISVELQVPLWSHVPSLFDIPPASHHMIGTKYIFK